ARPRPPLHLRLRGPHPGPPHPRRPRHPRPHRPNGP
ncbi:MAG: hypothetical protein AVDCRST_MAG89-648, partial [uncultured Gemmatimonadetes bacterium]